jgi:phospholipid-translocating ATPase
MIIVRGGENARPVYTQMVNAMREFFPETDILDEEAVQETMKGYAHPGTDGPFPLRRVNTGVTSIVGSDNGERPGGFVLVIDGSALTDVSVQKKC